MWSAVTGIVKHHNLIKYLTYGRIKSGLRDKVFGRFWNLLDPLALLAIYYFVFNIVFRSRIENFVLYLFSAIIAFQFFANTVKAASSTIVKNSSLISQAYFPRAVLPISIMLAGINDYIFAFVVLIVITVIIGVPLTPLLLLWPVVFAVQAVFTLGIALLVANIGVYFRDIENILNIVFRILFYFSAIMYSISRVPTELQPLFRYNPLYIFFESYRNILMYNSPPPVLHLSVTCFIGMLLLLLSLKMMSANEGHYIKYL